MCKEQERQSERLQTLEGRDGESGADGSPAIIGDITISGVGSEGMLAIYRPIVLAHEGTLEDPIPFIEGMDCERDKYYSYNGEIYKALQDMTPCVWAPGTQGTEAVWQKVN